MTTAMIVLISIGLGASAWLMLWLSDLLLSDRFPKRDPSRCQIQVNASMTTPAPKSISIGLAGGDGASLGANYMKEYDREESGSYHSRFQAGNGENCSSCGGRRGDDHYRSVRHRATTGANDHVSRN
jgi:hypothetical protein